MAVELVYETHSTSVDNENGIATGWLDGELSELGRRQAEELGARRRDVAAVYASDLGRAVETAATVSSWPVIGSPSGRPVSASHSRTLLSALPEAICWPSS